MPIFRRLAFALAALGMVIAGSSYAQGVTDGQKEQAARLVEAIHVADAFADAPIKDTIAIESQIVSAYPNLADRVNAIVQEEALILADRFQAFKDEAALIYAKAFTEEELKKLADFFFTDVGQKMLNEQEIMFREVGRAAEIWREGFRKDLAVAVQKRIDEMPDIAGSDAGAAASEEAGEADAGKADN